MVTFLTIIYIMVCVFLVLVVLLQAGRGGGMGAAMGGSSQTVFGGAGASNFLQRLTVVSATLFMLLSAVLAYMSSTGEQSLERAAERMRERQEALQQQEAVGAPRTKDSAAIADAGEGSPGDGTGREKDIAKDKMTTGEEAPTDPEAAPPRENE